MMVLFGLGTLREIVWFQIIELAQLVRLYRNRAKMVRSDLSPFPESEECRPVVLGKFSVFNLSYFTFSFLALVEIFVLHISLTIKHDFVELSVVRNQF